MGDFYGKGGDYANPFFPNEENWEGPSKTISSPVGSIFEHDIAKSNTFEDRLSNSGAVPGHSTKSESASRSMGSRKKGGR